MLIYQRVYVTNYQRLHTTWPFFGRRVEANGIAETRKDRPDGTRGVTSAWPWQKAHPQLTSCETNVGIRHESSISGWWFQPSEKYDFVSWDYDSQCMEKT